jgi:predicted nucleic acid-binding protein
VIYLDTGCLIKLYYPEPESPRVAALVSGKTIALVALHELELANALELKLFRKEASATEVRSTSALVERDIRAGVLHRPALHWEDVLRDAGAIARAHTRRLGCRSLDILHCSAARSLTVTSFVTTDTRQRRLAVKLGLTCPAL